MTPDEVRECIQGWERGAAKLRPIVAAQEPVEYDSDRDGCESCFDPDTEEMQQLKYLERKIDAWKGCLAVLELYERQSSAVKADDAVAWVWSQLRRRLEWATSEERSCYVETRFVKALVQAMYTTNEEVHSFMRDLVHIQNQGPFGYYLLPQEFMRDVVRLGLMDSPAERLTRTHTAPATASGQ